MIRALQYLAVGLICHAIFYSTRLDPLSVWTLLWLLLWPAMLLIELFWLGVAMILSAVAVLVIWAVGETILHAIRGRAATMPPPANRNDRITPWEKQS